jgi:hypothetical protein
MILYFVRFQTFESPGYTCTANAEKPAETWAQAKARRNEVFADPQMRRCWVERIDRRRDGDLTVDISKERWGIVMRREAPEPAAPKP